MPPEESDTAQTKARTRIGRRDAILKGLAGVGVAASGAIGLSALASPASAAIQDATYLVQDPSPDLTAEKVVGTDLTLSGWDYIVWTNGTTVYGQNGRTSKIDFSGTDWAAIVNSIIGTVGAETIFVHPETQRPRCVAQPYGASKWTNWKFPHRVLVSTSTAGRLASAG